MAENQLVGPVEAIHWNPHAWSLPLLGRRLGPRVNNFGDLLGPMIVARIAAAEGLVAQSSASQGRTRLLSVGSVVHFGRDGDVVWGSGVNGKMDADRYAFEALDVRAVRGPKTRAFLQQRGIDVPAIYGDPGLLFADLFSELGLRSRPKTRSVTVMPNLNDRRAVSSRHASIVVLPTEGVTACVQAIAESEYVVASSLHAIVIAESIGTPCRLVAATAESPFKYEDYYLGTGRDPIEPAPSVEAALAESPVEPALEWDPAPLLSAFPRDLWRASSEDPQP